MHYGGFKYKRLWTFPGTDPPSYLAGLTIHRTEINTAGSGSIIEVATSEVRNMNEDRTCVLYLTGVYQSLVI
jgi:hypothetical protein